MALEVDLHAHTDRSPSCGWMAPEALVSTARERGLDGIAVTDHNTMAACEVASDAAPDDLLVVPGEEVDTPDGQITGLFLEEAIEPWQSPERVLAEIHAQGGLAYAPHPFDRFREALGDLDAYADELDAVEVLNSRCVRDEFNRRAKEFADRRGLPGTGGSDAHFAREVGRAYTVIDADRATTRDRTLSRIREAIRDGRIEAAGGRGTVLNHAGTKLVKSYNRWRSHSGDGSRRS